MGIKKVLAAFVLSCLGGLTLVSTAQAASPTPRAALQRLCDGRANLLRIASRGASRRIGWTHRRHSHGHDCTSHERDQPVERRSTVGQGRKRGTGDHHSGRYVDRNQLLRKLAELHLLVFV